MVEFEVGRGCGRATGLTAQRVNEFNQLFARVEVAKPCGTHKARCASLQSTAYARRINLPSPASRDAEVTVFGANGPLLLDTVRTVIRGLEHSPVRYKYLSIEDHRALLEADLAAGVKVQVTELLHHAHFAAAATLARAYQWAEGCLLAYSRDLFLPFCASARGLLEAVGDSYDGLPRVPLALAEQKRAIKSALAGTSPPQMLNYKEVEDFLLHFAHGKRVDRAQRASAPDYVEAKLPSTYTKPLEARPPGGFLGRYQELCELTHPASDSVCYMLVPDAEGRLELHPSVDRERIQTHVIAHQARLAELLRISQVPALVMLKVLLHIGPPELHVNTVRGIGLRDIRLWQKCAAALGVSP